ncbi:MAG TPA: L-threonylcarbamoyladenylate synthase [Gemmatimonadaceae bacterium]
MRVVRVDPEHPDPEAIAPAAALLREGGLVAFPTETVYGLGAHALEEKAVLRIYEAKGRPSFNPLIVHVADVEGARRLVSAWPERAQRLAEVFWPGPLTLVLPRDRSVPDVVTAGLDAVAVRIPSHPVALALLTAARVPVAAPSANRFTRVSPTTAEHVVRSLGDRVDLVLDGGPTSVGIESTVLALTDDEATLLRPGIVSAEQIAAVIGPLRGAAPVVPAGAPRASPGMVERHYAPRAAVRLAEAPAEIARLAREGIAEGQVVGALLRTPVPVDATHVVHLPDEPAGYAQRLYASLHALDDVGCELIVVQRVPSSGAWAGVHDRLERAAR